MECFLKCGSLAGATVSIPDYLRISSVLLETSFVLTNSHINIEETYTGILLWAFYEASAKNINIALGE